MGELGYLRCHCGRFVANILRVTDAKYGPYNPWYGWPFKDFGTCKVHGRIEIIADGDMFEDEWPSPMEEEFVATANERHGKGPR